MSGQATCSLWEALTALAFNDPTPVATVPHAINAQRWGHSPADALTELNGAVHFLCDACYRGDVRIWGRRIPQSPDVNPCLGAPKKLTQAECLHNRLIVIYRDALLPRSGIGDGFDDTFAAEASVGGFDDVNVDRADLHRLLAMANQPTSGAEHDCEVWLRKQFAGDPEKLKKRGSFEADAANHFGRRLSRRAFGRVWAKVAPAEGRDKPGRSKSNHNTK